MESLEKSLVLRLKNDYTNLLQAARILKSSELYEEAFRGLVSMKAEFTRQEAHIIGADLLFDILRVVHKGPRAVKLKMPWN